MHTPNSDGAQEKGKDDKPKSKSASQQGFINKINHFDNFVKLLEGEPLYLPNEDDLTVNALQAVLADLRNKNTIANQAEEDLKNARNELYSILYSILYAKTTGMYDITMAVKKYTKGLTNPSSVEYKKLTALKFVKYKKK